MAQEDAAPSATSPPNRPLPWQGCAVFAFLAVVGLSALYGNLRYTIWAEETDWNRRAPIIAVADSATYGIGLMCELSQSGRFLSVGVLTQPVARYLDTLTGQPVTIVLPPDLVQSQVASQTEPRYYRPGIPLRDEVFLIYDRYIEGPDNSIKYQIPVHGWLVDVATRTVTNTDDLTPQQRMVYLDLAAEHNRRGLDWSGNTYSQRLQSPDGRYTASGHDDGEIRDQAGKVRNRFVYHSAIINRTRGTFCRDGWRRDSTGIYFLEQRLGREAPLLRLMLAEPPAPPWYQRVGQVPERWRELDPAVGTPATVAPSR